MGGRGSGRKKKTPAEEYKPARQNKPEERAYTVPAELKKVKTSSGCRFGS